MASDNGDSTKRYWRNGIFTPPNGVADATYAQVPNGASAQGNGEAASGAEGRAKGDKRARILNAAIVVFAQKGFHQARVSDVAGEAGVADGTIYLYFKNKDDLLLTLFEEKMDEILAGLEQVLEGLDDPVERVRAFARYHAWQVRTNRALAEVFQVELRLSNKFLKEYRPQKLWNYLGLFGKIVREGQARGIFRPELDPFILMWAFFGSLDELAMQWVLARRREKFRVEDAAEMVAETFIRGMSV
jgi:TetR/AcrR family transcriptional regulator, fatty acid metabolism regulator protein